MKKPNCLYSMFDQLDTRSPSRRRTDQKYLLSGDSGLAAWRGSRERTRISVGK